MESEKALLHLLEALEKTKPCQNLLIEALSSFKKCLVVLEGQVDKINEENSEIQDKMGKMQKAVEVLTKLLKELESSVFTETQSVTLREKLHGRNADSGVVMSTASSVPSCVFDDDDSKKHSLASIDSVLSDSPSWNEHVNDLSGQSYAPDNILPEEHDRVLRLLKPLNEIEPIASEGECAPNEQEQSTEEQCALCFMNRTWNQISPESQGKAIQGEIYAQPTCKPQCSSRNGDGTRNMPPVVQCSRQMWHGELIPNVYYDGI